MVGFTIVTYIGYDIVGLVLPSMLFDNAMMIIVSGLATLRRHGWRIAIFALLGISRRRPLGWVRNHTVS
ncbi:hypothetical protein [Arthrobacter sp. TS-15]|uniref:hypothetical protein n=1 Tax=Arthrobacter sp. TS-15 TaxID=2510797 RepID=UPI001EE929DA|nr:hypothetical protein [Arthrobacter sp. TS-15]